MGRLDPISLLPALAQTGWSVATRPERSVRTLSTGLAESWSAGAAAAVRALGGESGDGAERARDKRFADPTWEQNAAYWLTRQLYSTWAETLLALVRDADTAPASKQKAEFAVQLMIDALAPTNFRSRKSGRAQEGPGDRRAFAGPRRPELRARPAAQRRVAAPGGDRRRTWSGRTWRSRPARSIFRNDLMELIQYAPSTPQVHAIPLLFSPPWINKYYIMDLAPGRSLVQWAVDHGHTVFMISYRNPDAVDARRADGRLPAVRADHSRST